MRMTRKQVIKYLKRLRNGMSTIDYAYISNCICVLKELEEKGTAQYKITRFKID